VKALAPQVLGHRVMLIAEAEMEGISPGTVITEALSTVTVRPSQRRAAPGPGHEPIRRGP
jgi:hypothetical protein